MNQSFRPIQRIHRRTAFLIAVTILSFLAFEIRPQAALFSVTRTNSTGPGSFAAIITQANAAPGDNTIEFAVPGTFTLDSPLPLITNNLTITGPTDKSVRIGGNNLVRLFHFMPGTTNLLQRLTLIDGWSDVNGGAILNEGVLKVDDGTFINNRALSGRGGAIHNAGQLIVQSTFFSANRAVEGGGVYNEGRLTWINCRADSNYAGTGAALFNAGTAELDQCVVTANKATQGLGGGVFNSGTVAINQSTLAQNEADGQSGVTGQDGYSIGDGAGGGGGGGGGGAGLGGAIFQDGGSLALTNCTISGNLAVGGGGGNGGSPPHGEGAGFPTDSPGGAGGTGGNAQGGAGGVGGGGFDPRVHLVPVAGAPGGFASGGGGGGGGEGSPTLTIFTGVGGGAGGFAAGAGGAGGNGSNLPGSAAYRSAQSGDGGSGGNGHGGGVFVRDGNAMLINCTVTANSALGGGPGAGRTTGIAGVGTAGGAYRQNGSFTLVNTIVAGNTAGNASPNLAGSFASSGFNLVSDNQGTTGLSINDYQNEPAKIGPLQDNGGPTLTHALLNGSLAIGGGTTVGAPVVDQRGVARPASHIDIGSYQTVPGITERPPHLSLQIVGGSPALTVEGVPGGLYRLESCAELTPGAWTKVTDLLLPSSPFTYQDSTSGSVPTRYYRLTVP